MPTDLLNFEILAERPVIRNDKVSDIDISVEMLTSKSVGTQSTGYAINICIVIDRSGSMDGDKLEQAKKSCVDIYENLNPNDRFTVLAFDDEVISVVNPQTPSSSVKDRIMAINSGGSTNLSKGFYLGLLELQTYSSDQHINRLLLLSDGQANAGEQKPSVLGSEASRARDELGITISTIGIGADFQEDILSVLAHESGGRFWFIGEARIEDIIKEEFSGALSVFLERPRIEVILPPGITILKELNDLPKISNVYRIRPIKANDHFSFALRLRVDPDSAADNKTKFQISASLFDGAGIVRQTELALAVGSIEEYVQSPENMRVKMAVNKFLSAASNENIIEQMDSGDLNKMLNMLEKQSSLMKDLEEKLAGAKTISWETQTDQEKYEAELQRLAQERKLAELRMEIEENEALAVVGQLVDIMLGLGQSEKAYALLAHSRKMYNQRQHRSWGYYERGDMDDWAARHLLESAAVNVKELINDYPALTEELSTISRKINEQLESFS